MNTFRILGHEIELNSDGLKKVLDIIDNAGHNDAKLISTTLVIQLANLLPEESEPKPEELVPAEPPASTLGHFNNYAYLREELVEKQELPPVVDYETGEESFLDPKLITTKFPCLQPDELDDEEYNLIIVLPNGKWYKTMSIDFEFMEIPVKQTFHVDVNRTGYASRSIKVTARTQVEANALALDEAGGYGYSEYGSDYELA